MLNEKDLNKAHTDTLKNRGNVKKKQMSKFILRDGLGSDGLHEIRDIKKAHLKVLRRDRLKINKVYRAMIYSDKKMAVRRTRLKKSIDNSTKGTYVKKNYWWRDAYDKEMEEIRARQCNN